MGGESLRPVGGSEGMRCSVDVGRPPPGPRPVLWPPANFSPQCTLLMSSPALAAELGRAGVLPAEQRVKLLPSFSLLPTGSAASRGGRRRKYWQFKTFNCDLSELESMSKKTLFKAH